MAHFMLTPQIIHTCLETSFCPTAVIPSISQPDCFTCSWGNSSLASWGSFTPVKSPVWCLSLVLWIKCLSPKARRLLTPTSPLFSPSSHLPIQSAFTIFFYFKCPYLLFGTKCHNHNLIQQRCHIWIPQIRQTQPSLCISWNVIGFWL